MQYDRDGILRSPNPLPEFEDATMARLMAASGTALIPPEVPLPTMSGSLAVTMEVTMRNAPANCHMDRGRLSQNWKENERIFSIRHKQEEWQ